MRQARAASSGEEYQSDARYSTGTEHRTHPGDEPGRRRRGERGERRGTTRTRTTGVTRRGPAAARAATTRPRITGTRRTTRSTRRAARSRTRWMWSRGGRVFTHPIADLQLPGPLPFTFERAYSSAASKEDQGLGWGWAHSLGRSSRSSDVGSGVEREGGFGQLRGAGDGALRARRLGLGVRRELMGLRRRRQRRGVARLLDAFDEGKTFRLSAISDRNKNRIALTYDDGKLGEVKDSAGRIIKVTSTKDGHDSVARGEERRASGPVDRLRTVRVRRPRDAWCA